MSTNPTKPDTQTKARVRKPPTVEQARRRVRIAEEDLSRKTKLLLSLEEVVSRNLKQMPEEEMNKALRSAKEEFGVSAALYADCLDELNAVCDSLDG
jgi:hypothetical protein